MEFKDYYKILGIAPSATDKEIKYAYRKLARTYHPDVSDHHQAEEKFKEIAEAYEVLKSTEKRAEYDEIRKYNSGKQSFTPPPNWQARNRNENSFYDSDYSDFFSSVFGHAFDSRSKTNRRTSQQGQNIETELPVFLEDSLTEKTKTISYHLGEVEKKLNVKIPAGVRDGDHVRLKGQGLPGTGGAANGDLYLRIRLVPHPLFDIEGYDLIITLPLAPWEAALGTKVTLPTLSGNVSLTIPPNTQSGQRLRIKAKGLIKKHGGHGDIYALIKIVIPTESNQNLNQYWEQLAQKSKFNPREQWGNLR